MLNSDSIPLLEALLPVMKSLVDPEIHEIDEPRLSQCQLEDFELAFEKYRCTGHVNVDQAVGGESGNNIGQQRAVAPSNIDSSSVEIPSGTKILNLNGNSGGSGNTDIILGTSTETSVGGGINNGIGNELEDLLLQLNRIWPELECSRQGARRFAIRLDTMNQLRCLFSPRQRSTTGWSREIFERILDFAIDNPDSEIDSEVEWYYPSRFTCTGGSALRLFLTPI